MRLLSLCWVVVLFCSHNLAAAVGWPVELLGTPKALANETSKSTGVTTDRAGITNDRLTTPSEPPPAFSKRKQGEASQMVEPKEQKTSPKSRPASSAMLQGARIARVTDHKAADAVTEFFRQEGTRRFNVHATEQQIRIADVIRNSDFPDHRIVTVDEYVQDVPVFGSRTAVEVVLDKKGVASVKKVKGEPSVSGRLVSQDRLIDLNTIPDVSWTEAIDRALGVYRQERRSSHTSKINSKINSGRCAVKVQLTIFDPTIVQLKADKARLAWYVRVDGVVVFIDAQDGSSIFHYDNRPSAFQLKIYDVDGGGQGECATVNPVLDENGPYPGAPPVSEDPKTNALKAKEEAKKAYEFFKKLGWNSYDNQGSTIQSCVRVADEDSWYNRFGQWDVDFHCIYFYPGLPDAEDIAGHEFTHGVIQFMPTLPPNPTNPDGGLLLENESGALAEALADFFGSQIEGHNWTIGEKLTCEEFFDKDFYCGTPNNTLPLRNMADPHKGSSSTDQCTYPPEAREPGFYPNCSPGIGWNQGQPDHYAELVNIGQDICKYIGVGGDRGCIHLNSGIFNKAMYLAANGGDHHSVPVHGIGKKKLTRIVFWTLRNEALSTAMGMKAFAEISHEACGQLSAKKKYQIRQADCDQFKSAFVAVGLLSP